MSSLFNNLLVEPLYNLLILLLNHVPFADLGIAVIIVTVLVKLVLYPISKNAINSQIKIKEIQAPLKELQEKHKNDQHKLATEMMKLYKDNNIKPFSSILLVLLQIPIILSLYFVFSRFGLPNINTEVLYSFVNVPEYVSPKLLGIFDIASKSMLLALFAAVTQFLQTRLMFKKNDLMKSKEPNKDNKEKNPNKMAEDMMKSMQLQMKYVMPVFMYFISLSLGPIVSLYFTASNIFSIFQEMFLKRKVN